MPMLARDRSDRTAALMFATAVSNFGETTPQCGRAANGATDLDRDPPPRPAAAAKQPARWPTLRVAA